MSHRVPIARAISSLWLNPRWRSFPAWSGRGTSTACVFKYSMGAITGSFGMRRPASTGASGRTPLNFSHSMPRCKECSEYERADIKPVRGVSSLHSLHVLPLGRSILHPMHCKRWGGVWRLHELQYHVPSMRQSMHRAGKSAFRKPFASNLSTRALRMFLVYDDSISRFFRMQDLFWRKFFIDNRVGNWIF